eukprot:1196356-Prorocentrum_minimum.AAC.4
MSAPSNAGGGYGVGGGAAARLPADRDLGDAERGEVLQLLRQRAHLQHRRAHVPGGGALQQDPAGGLR